MIRAAVVSSGLPWIASCYRSCPAIDFRLAPASRPEGPDLADADWAVVPNGSDHVAMWRARAAVRELLARGGALICDDGWFTWERHGGTLFASTKDPIVEHGVRLAEPRARVEIGA